MDVTTKTPGMKPAGFTQMEAPQVFLKWRKREPRKPKTLTKR